MIENQEVMEAFYAGRRSAAYPLAVNDVVFVKEGRRSGSLAAVISPQAVAPIVRYLVEYGDGSDGIVPLAALELREPMQPPQRNAGRRPSSGDSPVSESPSLARPAWLIRIV